MLKSCVPAWNRKMVEERWREKGGIKKINVSAQG